ncbi:transposase [Burkholderia latens]|uniref:Transposase n=1 Tax=Burkholderia latens TaxID=488446 RepID=A0A6H9T6P8_9BURK|nr:transposase [Burkholderia latens]KAB0644791.1 transposase [Burkholderia latens]
MTTEAPKRIGRKGVPNHPLEFRREMARLACEPGVSVARSAMAHGLNANLVFKWRGSFRAGEYDPVGLVPVKADVPTTEIAPLAPMSSTTLSYRRNSSSFPAIRMHSCFRTEVCCHYWIFLDGFLSETPERSCDNCLIVSSLNRL